MGAGGDRKENFMKKRVLFLVQLLCMLCSLFLYSCNDNDGGDESGNSNGGSETNQNGSIKPPMGEANLPFVGVWNGQGPYLASGVSYTKFGLVAGTWEFHNDSTYFWVGYNSFGYEYSEEGKWHYNSENKMLITDSPCGFIWQVEEIMANSWVGTMLNSKGGTYTYTRKADKKVSVGDVRVVDYEKCSLIVKDTIVNYDLCTQDLKCGICYGKKSNSDVSTFTKVYANKVYTQVISDHFGSVCAVTKGIYDVKINNLEENEKYRLCGFIEYEDGTTVYSKKIYNAISITPLENSIYLGEEPHYKNKNTKSGKVHFWAGCLNQEGVFVDLTLGGKAGYFEKEKVAEALARLGEGWRLPSLSDFANFCQPRLYQMQVFLNKKKDHLEFLDFKSVINGNNLRFSF